MLLMGKSTINGHFQLQTVSSPECTLLNFAATIHYTHISMIQHISVSRQNSSENKRGSKDDYHKS